MSFVFLSSEDVLAVLNVQAASTLYQQELLEFLIREMTLLDQLVEKSIIWVADFVDGQQKWPVFPIKQLVSISSKNVQLFTDLI